MKKIFDLIEKTATGEIVPLSASASKRLFNKLDNFMTGTSKRLGRGSTQRFEYEAKTPMGSYFVVSVFDNGTIEVQKGSPYGSSTPYGVSGIISRRI